MTERLIRTEMLLSAMCWAISSPAAAGTQTAEPGTLLRPGGGASGCEGSVGGSSLNTTVRRSTPRRRTNSSPAPRTKIPGTFTVPLS